MPSIILTLMVPYFSLDPLAPLPSAFDLVGWYVAAYIIDVGAICSLATWLVFENLLLCLDGLQKPLNIAVKA